MVKIKFVNEGITVKVKKGTTILQASREAGIVIESPCNGMGTCGKCKVKIQSEGYALACQTKVTEDIAVETEYSDIQKKTLKILSEGERFNYKIDNDITKKFDGQITKIFLDNREIGKEHGDTADWCYGISADIGTTTLVCALIDLYTGKELGAVSSLNPQSLYAQDVLTRIKFASTREGLKLMFESIIKELNRMIKKLCDNAKINRKFIYEIVYSGNTTMIHLVLNTNPESLGRYPYTPILRGGNYMEAHKNGIEISPFGFIYVPSIISAFVGADITSGILATGLQTRNDIVLLIDIGTNGEMVIAKNGSLSATSTAAGPAFEGMNITFGMRAEDGAIESFQINDDGSIDMKVIGDVKAKGICGSGLFDIVGELVRVGIIEKNGKLVLPEKMDLSKKLKLHLQLYRGKLAFRVAEEVYLTLKDIRQVQLAKGAVRAGITALFQNQKIKAEDVDQILIAGSFGYHLRESSLLNISLLPKVFENKIRFVGNTSKTGGETFLLNRSCRKAMEEIVKNISYIDLSNIDNFEHIFVNSLNFTKD